MGRLTRMAAGAALSIVAAGPAWAGVQGEVVAFGETTAERERAAAPTRDDSGLSPRTEIEGIRYVGHSDVLAGQLCLRFGVSIRLEEDRGAGLPGVIMSRLDHPRITRADGASSTQDSFPTPVIGGMAYAGWTFDEDWELQPGEWTFSFLAEGHVLASKTFTVTVAVPHGSICGGEPVS